MGDICIRILGVQKSKKMTYEYEYIENCSEYTGGEPPGGPILSTVELCANPVTSGNGIYVDPIEENRCVYRGSNPDNYITFNDELWRIIAVEPDGTLKIMSEESVGPIVFDYGFSWNSTDLDYKKELSRYSTSLSDYCYGSPLVASFVYLGCNVWGSRTTMLDVNGNHISTMRAAALFINYEYELPEKEAYINTYLNTTYYDSINSDKQFIDNHIFNVGIVPGNQGYDPTLETTSNQEKAYKWRGKIGLISATDYIKASSSNGCTGMKKAQSYSSTCKSQNFIMKDMYHWIITPHSHSYESDIADGSETSMDRLDILVTLYANQPRNIHPTLYLKSNISLSGKGTEINPYVIKN